MTEAYNTSMEIWNQDKYTFEALMDAASAENITAMKQFLLHSKLQNEKKLKALHEHLKQGAQLTWAKKHMDMMLDRFSELVWDAILVKFARADGFIKVESVTTELDTQLRLKARAGSSGDAGMTD